MPQKNPEITAKFLRKIKRQKAQIKVIDGIKIKVCSGVFPPQSAFSRSSKKLRTIFGNLKNKIVLDIGTGTGIQSIQAAKMGAKRVLACDINSEVVKCAKSNIKLNNLAHKITIFKSDLFKSIPKQKFDLIIANLPIVDFPTSDVVGLSLYDPGFVLHKRLFKQIHNYLKTTGYLVMPHANLQSENDFKILENLIHKHRLDISRIVQYKTLGYLWRYYRICLRQSKKYKTRKTH